MKDPEPRELAVRDEGFVDDGLIDESVDQVGEFRSPVYAKVQMSLHFMVKLLWVPFEHDVPAGQPESFLGPL